MWMARPPAPADDNPMSEHAMVQSARMAALGELSAGAAHEINNPLFAILTLVGFLLRDAEPGTKTYERLRLIEESAQDIQAVVERVQGFARDRRTAGGAVALQEIAHESVELVRRASASRTVEIVERYAGEHALVFGDAAQLKSLFVHLLVNGLQAMPEGGVLSVEVDRDGDEVVARVRDEGSGIPDGDEELVFDIFYTTKNGSGTGLGLAGARAVAQLHGGTLAVDRSAERGACFVLRLPRAAE